MYFKRFFNLFKPKDELMKLVDDIEDIQGFIDYRVIAILYVIKKLSNYIEGSECIENEEVYILCYNEHKFYYPKRCMWSSIIKDIENMPYNLTYAVNKIIELNNLDAAYNVDYTKFGKDERSREVLKRVVDIVDNDGDKLRKILKYMCKSDYIVTIMM